MSENVSTLVCYEPRANEPWVRIICFPHAGGGPHSFAHLDVPEWMEVHVVSYAGRGARYAEPFAKDFESVSREAFSSIRAFADRPLVLVGHSFGALLAFDVATKLESETNAMLLRLVVSSCPEPSIRLKDERWSQMADAALVTALASLGWLPAAVSGGGGAGLVAHALPPLRADLALYEQYEVSKDMCLQCGITATGGALDTSVPLEQLVAWQQRSHNPENCNVSLVADAGHFHIESHALDFAGLLEETARIAFEATPSSVICGPPHHVDMDEPTIFDLIAANANEIPHAPIVFEPFFTSPSAPPSNKLLTSERGATTFKSMIATANIVAAVLIDRYQVTPGDIVAVYHEPSTAYILANLAIFAAGGAMVYFEVNYTTSLIEQLLIASQARCVLTNARLRAKALAPLLSQSLSHQQSTELPEVKCLELNVQRNELGGVSWLFLDQDPCRRYLDRANSIVASQAAPNMSSLAYCSMSSGTTGRPKAILVEHHSVVHNFRVRDAVCPYESDDDRDGCNVFFVWEALRGPSKGRVTVVIPDDVVVDARSLASFIKAHRITRCMLTPSLLRNLLDQPGLDARRVLGHLRYVLLEGEVVPHQLVQDFRRAFYAQSENEPKFPSLINYYSTWESLDSTSTILAPTMGKQSQLSHESSHFAAAVGSPLPGVCILVIDRRTRRALPRGVPGFVLVVASSVARGYLSDEAKTKDRFSSNPMPDLAKSDPSVRYALQQNADSEMSWVLETSDQQIHPIRCYDTGDRGLVTATGELFLLGRADATVKLRGFKVALNYVETATLELSSVRACVVRPVVNQSTQQPESLVAYIVPSEEFNQKKQAFVSAVRAHHKATLPEYAVPAYLIPLETLPTKLGSGKLDFTRLPPPTDADRAHVWNEGNDNMRVDRSTIIPSSSEGERSDFDKRSSGSARVAAGVITAAFCETLGRQDVTRDANFFELGGHSLHAAKIVGVIAEKLGVELRVVELFERPTIEALALLISAKLRGDDTNVNNVDTLAMHSILTDVPEMEPMRIAVTGAAGLFPGSSDVKSFWNHLLESHDSLSTLSFAELAERGVPEDILTRADFVPKAQKLNGADVVSFDALFWGISAAESRIMDPQHRKLLEVAWRARETAGRGMRSGHNNEDAYGVFASSGIDGYMIHHLNGLPLKDAQDPAQIFLGEVGSEKDYACTRISYQCGLRGPSIAVNSACSSALVAATLAVNSINNRECVGAVVGATSITFPNLGYIYVDGLVGSQDGVVRPLDAAASGTLFGDSVGAICLEAMVKSHNLNESSRDGHFNTINSNLDRTALALVLGGATTNDGRLKAGYTAPSAEAQALAIARSTRRSKIPRLDYVELHATATKVGDAIELAGLGRALGLTGMSSNEKTKTPLLLGSIKGNIGHANCAAGFTGLLKACLCLAHGRVPATAHYTKLNPRIKLPTNTIVVSHGDKSAALSRSRTNGPSYAGVSSFGVGGTNAHLTLCSPPERNDAARNGGGYYGEVENRFRPRKLARPQFIAWDSEDIERPQGAGTRPADADEAADAATYAAMRDAAAAAAVDFGVDPTDARRKALEAMRLVGIPSKDLTVSIDFSEGLQDGGHQLSVHSATETAFFGNSLGMSGRVNSLDALVGMVGDDGLTLTEATSRIPKNGDADTPDKPELNLNGDTNYEDAWDQHAVLGTLPAEIRPLREIRRPRRKPTRRRAELILLSARTKESLNEQRNVVAAFMQRCVDDDEDVYLADVAKTLQEGREHWPDWRVAVSARTLKEAASKLQAAELIPREKNRTSNMDVLCLQLGDRISNHGLEHGVGRALFETHAEFRSQIQACASIIDAPLRELPPIDGTRAPNGLLDALGYMVDEVDLEPGSTFARHGRSSLLATQAMLTRPAVAQPVTFALLYALAACFLTFDDTSNTYAEILDAAKRTLISDVRFFAAIAGHGIGQIVALALDGAVALDNALIFCLERGRCVEEASNDAAERFEAFLTTKFENEPKWIHSPSRTAVADNVSGQWLNAFNAADPEYWREHFELECDNQLKWDANFRALERWDPGVIINVDTRLNKDSEFTLEHGRALCDIGRSDDADAYAVTDALAAVWLTGVAVDWPAARLSARGYSSRGREARFIAGVPGYVFARTSFWINPRASVYGDISSDDMSTKNIQHSAASTKRAQSTLDTSPCLVDKTARRQKEGANISARVVCAAYAGGSSSSFTQWATAAPDWLQVLAIESAGRGARADESSPTCDDDDSREIASVCDAILNVACRDRTPWALLGLSAGGLQVVEVYHELLRRSTEDRRAERALSRLTCIFVAGRAPPDLALAESGALDTPIPSDEEITSVYALADDATLQSEAYRTVALPRLRADLKTDARAERRVATLLKERVFDNAPVSPTVIIAGGIEDPSFSPTDLSRWQALAGISDFFECKFYTGGHEFLVTRHNELLADLTARFSSKKSVFAQTYEKTISDHSLTENPLYTVRWEDVGTVDSPSLNEEPFAETLPTTRLCDLRRNALIENDPEILDETALDALNRGTMIIDGLDTSVDDEEGDKQHEYDWIKRDEEEAWCLVEVLQRIGENTTGRVDVTLVSRASPRGALAAGASKCARYEIGLFSFRRVYIRIDGSSVLRLGNGRESFVRWAVEAGRQASKSNGEEDILLWPNGAVGNDVRWHASILRARPQAIDSKVFSETSIASQVANQTVLVTGATGGLGKALVQWLEAMGANVIKLGRRLPPGEDASKFVVAAVDDFSSLASNTILASCRRITMIFHLAGMLIDATISNLSQDAFCKPIAPKAHGLVALRNIAAQRNWGTKCIVAYSSTTSLYGFGGQTNYAAANTFLDAFADFSDDLPPLAGAPPVLAIHWGPWAEAGMAAVGTKASEHALRVGDRPLPTAEALRCLGFILQSGALAARYAIFSVNDWSKSPWKSLEAVRHLVQSSSNKHSLMADAAIISTTAEKEATSDAVDDFLRHRVSQWLPDETLESLGLDSLDLAQMRAQAAELVGNPVPMAIFTAPDRTLNELADALRSQIRKVNSK